jgi:hypothetical protein
MAPGFSPTPVHFSLTARDRTWLVEALNMLIGVKQLSLTSAPGPADYSGNDKAIRDIHDLVELRGIVERGP